MAVVLLTDGAHHVGAGPDTLISRFAGAGVKIHTIAIGGGADRNLLAKLASSAGGQAEIATDEKALLDILTNVILKAGLQEYLVEKRGVIKPGNKITLSFSVDAGSSGISASHHRPGSDLDLELVAPDGKLYTVKDAVRASTGSERPTCEVIRIDNPLPGGWQARITAVDVPAGGNPIASQFRRQLRSSPIGGSNRPGRASGRR